MKKIVIACDSFKGCCTAQQAAGRIEKGVHVVMPECEVVKIPLADGGEGLVQVLSGVLGCEWIACEVHDPLMKKRTARYAWHSGSRTAVMEMAEASGLPLVPPDERRPLYTTSHGTGEMIADALRRGCRKFIIGIGGSATSDGGIGMMQALGVRFTDAFGRPSWKGGDALSQVANIDTSGLMPEALESEFTIVCDVRNPLWGEDGAACVFAPQKGASAGEVKISDKGLEHYAGLLKEQLDKDVASVPGSGAAGGLGAAFLAFLPAELKPGIDCVLDMLGFDRLIAGADLIITGEGKTDAQSLMGKVVSGVLEKARKQQIPVIVVSGTVEQTPALNEAGLLSVFSVQQAPVSLEKAMEPDYAGENIEQTVVQLMRMIGYFENKDRKRDI